MLRIWRHIKNVLLALVFIAGPVLYAYGRREGSQNEETRRDAAINAEKADFYKRMDAHHNEADPIRNRTDLTGRLRDSGL